jgi:predicted nucleic acid-binding protein
LRTIFLDTVGLLAVWDESDQWHPAAQAAFVQLETQRASLITTSLVLAETANAAAQRSS